MPEHKFKQSAVGAHRKKRKQGSLLAGGDRGAGSERMSHFRDRMSILGRAEYTAKKNKVNGWL